MMNDSSSGCSQTSDSSADRQQAAASLAQGQYETAIALYSQYIADDPESLSNYWYLGLALLLQGDEVEAQAVWFSAVTLLDPDTAAVEMADLLQILTVEAEQQLHHRKPHLAERIYLQALELDTAQANLHLGLGEAIAQQGRYDEAITYWQNAIDLEPDFAAAYRKQAEVWQKLGQLSEAIAAYACAIDLQSDWDTHYQLGLCLAQQQQWQEAINQFNQTIQLNPTFSPAYGDRGWAHLQQGNWQNVLLDFREAIQEKSNFEQVYCTWVDTLNQQEKANSRLNSNAQFLKRLCIQSDATETNSTLKDQQIPTRKNEWSNAEDESEIDRQSTQSQSALTQPVNEPRNERKITSVALPQGFYKTAQDWAIATQISDNHYIRLDSTSKIHLTLPKTLDQEVHFSFRFGNQITLPGTFVVTILNGQFWTDSDQTCNAVLTSDHQLLSDLSPEFPLLSPGHPDKHPGRHSIFTASQLPPIEFINATVAVLAGLANDMYFHWMFDGLPRINLLQRSGLDLEQIDYFLVSNRLPFQKETLAAFNIPTAKILELNQHPHIQATRLIVPSFPGSPAWMPQWACCWLKDNLLNKYIGSSTGRNGRLYISRQRTDSRRIINEQQVIHLLSEFGFHCVVLESLSVQEQATLLSNADAVVSPHGSGLTNIVFCQPGTKVIEIFSPCYVYPCYWLVSNLVELEYYYLLGKMPEGFYLHKHLYPDARLEDIYVDLDELRNILQLAQIA